MELKPGYKQTDVGAIPEAWEVRRLSDLIQSSRSIRYGIVQPGKYETTGCFMLRSQDYSKSWAGPNGMHKVSAQLENQYRNAKICHDDLVTTVVGAGIGQVVVIPDWLDGAILSRSTARTAIDKDKAAPSFVKAFLESPIGKRQILDCQKEGAQPVVSCLDLAKFVVAYPPPGEQLVIAAALSDVDALLDALDRLIAKKRDLKQAAMPATPHRPNPPPRLPRRVGIEIVARSLSFPRR
jgi:type I restriction enzyme S subunit